MLEKKKVLFVDSSGNMRFTMKTMLRDLGIEHLETLPPTTALLSHIQHQHFDFVIISHNETDKISGIQLLEEARYQGLLPETTAWILLIGDTSRDLIVHAIDNYPDDILSKPFSARDLRHRLALLDARQTALEPIWRSLKEKNVKEALNLCDHFDTTHPFYCAVHLLKGRILMSHHRYFQAARVFSHIYQHFGRREAVLMQAYCLGQEGQFDAALELLAELACQNPFLLAAYDQLIQIEMQRGDYFKARYLLQQSVSVSPLNPLRYQRLGYCAFQQNDWAVAAPALSKAIKLGEGSVYETKHPYLQLVDVARHRVESGENWQDLEREMESTLRKASRVFQQDETLQVESALLKSRFYDGARQPHMAERFAKEASTLAQMHGVSLENLNIWTIPGDTPVRWLQNVPSDPSMMHDRNRLDSMLAQACYAYERGDASGAMQLFAQVLRIDPRHPDALLGAAQLYLEAVRDSQYQREKRLKMARQCLQNLQRLPLDSTQQERFDYLKTLVLMDAQLLPKGSLGDLLWEAV
ncbi:tetratricopeptide repeat protein [Pokkaliibacter sp. CJK22405]|uniref:tetratricopeptide repeat protein n=1 Tax=Pokkaliibacter sp. CJK22405 TaxID=3384615 RepID=UPI003984B94F